MSDAHLYWMLASGPNSYVWAFVGAVNGFYDARLYAAELPTEPPRSDRFACYRGEGQHVIKITREDCKALIVAARARHALEST